MALINAYYRMGEMRKSFQYPIENPTLKVGKFGDEYISGTFGNSNEFHLRFIGGEYVFHNLEGPALILQREIPIQTFVYFYVDGLIHTIEDSPLDDELKVILKLRYGNPTVGEYLYQL